MCKSLIICFDIPRINCTLESDDVIPTLFPRCGNAILLMALIELTTISWFYGSKKMMRHITDDMEIPVPKFMQVKKTFLILSESVKPFV